jgi:hypothetical protein
LNAKYAMSLYKKVFVVVRQDKRLRGAKNPAHPVHPLSYAAFATPNMEKGIFGQAVTLIWGAALRSLRFNADTGMIDITPKVSRASVDHEIL